MIDKKNECIRCFHVDTYLHKWVTMVKTVYKLVNEKTFLLYLK